MKGKVTHKMRVDKVKDFTNNNKVFTVVAIVIVIYLLFSFVNSNLNKADNNTPDVSSSQSESYTAESSTAEIPEDDGLHWRFYWIDLWIFIGAGGFCTVMILKEKKKAREKLQ